MTDLRPVLDHALTVTDSLVAAVGPDDLTRPTPCSEYDVEALVDHLSMVVDRLRIVTAGGDFTTSSGDAGWDAGLAALREAMPEIDLDREVTAPFGTMPAGVMLGSYVGELTVHSWDLARALDRDDLLDPALAEAIVGPATERLPREGREHFPFAEVVDVDDDAPAIDRLVGWFGRDPGWSA